MKNYLLFWKKIIFFFNFRVWRYTIKDRSTTQLCKNHKFVCSFYFLLSFCVWVQQRFFFLGPRRDIHKTQHNNNGQFFWTVIYHSGCIRHCTKQKAELKGLMSTLTQWRHFLLSFFFLFLSFHMLLNISEYENFEYTVIFFRKKRKMNGQQCANDDISFLLSFIKGSPASDSDFAKLRCFVPKIYFFFFLSFAFL